MVSSSFRTRCPQEPAQERERSLCRVQTVLGPCVGNASDLTKRSSHQKAVPGRSLERATEGELGLALMWHELSSHGQEVLVQIAETCKQCRLGCVLRQRRNTLDPGAVSSCLHAATGEGPRWFIAKDSRGDARPLRAAPAGSGPGIPCRGTCSILWRCACGLFVVVPRPPRMPKRLLLCCSDPRKNPCYHTNFPIVWHSRSG